MKPDWPIVIRQIIAQTDCEYADIAKHCGCSKAAVDHWLQGIKRPRFESGWQLLNAYVAHVGTNIPQISEGRR